MTARERFVEAMRLMPANQTPIMGRVMRQAVEAFADLECEVQPLKHLPETYPHVDHVACRAALLRECGLGEP